MTYGQLAAISSDNFKHNLTRDEWVDYFSADKIELVTLCAFDYAEMTTELRYVCQPHYTPDTRSTPRLLGMTGREEIKKHVNSPSVYS